MNLNTISTRIPGCAESLIKFISKQQRSIESYSSFCLYPTGLEMNRGADRQGLEGQRRSGK